ncbi:potato proteinase inhibitor type I family protein [Kitasatospora sp. SolWspMP-SS2h]|uniref:serine protease inhibitor n=1 Tax=Kitasatospora sp. SolWspMP-SS2h TaxID=1305729 RepID=UPI000DBF7F76|nr:serine protease inhibitor [Kitasatospora sp. SolWspMP-SS2h]RAJ31748.1 potato proteinase inhibitor type I family protein [Kitasatospora sp. SolWspMP-SS2h]
MQEEWPELLGKSVVEAERVIRAANSGITEVAVIADGDMASADYREDRVRVYVDEAKIVSQVPRVG